jgi:hypothetical protein
MIFDSYQQLKTFANMLDNEGISKASVPLTEHETMRFVQLYDSIREQFTAALIDDLGKLFSAALSIEKDKFYPEDSDLQGASHIDVKLKMSENDNSFHINVQCLVFAGRIILWHDTPEILKLKLGEKSLRTLKRFRKTGEYHFVSELLYLE